MVTGWRSRFFADEVRKRDGQCVITGTEAKLDHHGVWWSFEACHIYPIAFQGYWNDKNYDNWIEIPPARISDGKINSVENGILLRRDIHRHFDVYDVSINPDVRIACLTLYSLWLITVGCIQDHVLLTRVGRTSNFWSSS